MTEALCATVDPESGATCYLGKGHGTWPGSSLWHEGNRPVTVHGSGESVNVRWPPPDEPMPRTERQPSGPRPRATVATSVRLSQGTHDRLGHAARERGVSARYLIERAVDEFLDRLIPPEEIRWTRDEPA